MQWNYRGSNIATSWQKLWRNCRQAGKQELPEVMLKRKGRAKTPGAALYLQQPEETLQYPASPSFHVSTGTASHSIKLRGARAAIKLITYALASVAMCCFSSRCSPRASGGERSKTVPLPEFSILLLFPQQNLLLWAQQFPLVRAKGKNMKWLTKRGHNFKAEDITLLCKKRPNPCFHISPCLSLTLPSATRDSPQPPLVPWDVATQLQFSPAEARNVPFPSANHFTWTRSFQVLQI